MRKILIYLIKGYQLFFSPWVGQHCRFTPTCSHYGIEAIQKYGVFKGSWLTIKRILRCNPLCDGGEDPVP